MVEVTLPDWLYQALEKKKMLKISQDYFRIRKAIDRRIYEIARKHCGNQGEFTISLEKLHMKSGSSALLNQSPMLPFCLARGARGSEGEQLAPGGLPIGSELRWPVPATATGYSMSEWPCRPCRKPM